MEKELYIEFELKTTLHHYADVHESYPDVFEIDITNELGSEKKIIGKAKIQRYIIGSAEEFLYECDNDSIDAFDIANELTKTNKEGYLDFIKNEFEDYSTFIFIKEIGLEKEYRGKGIMQNLFKALDRYFECGCVYVLLASPIDYTNGEFGKSEDIGKKIELTESLKKVMGSYKKVGFKQIKPKSQCMYKILPY